MTSRQLTPINFWLKLFTTATALFLLSSCGNIRYYAHCTRGHLALLAERKPIPDLLQDSTLPKELRSRLHDSLLIRDFASQILRLPDNASYRSYADLKRPFATWNVVAAPEFSLVPAEWCFPIAGCVTYRGFFTRRSAENFAEKLRREGFDVYLYGVEAYSTLGWFDDPVLNTFLHLPTPHLAGVIFHELAHQQLYVPGDTAFSEAFAMAVEMLGVEHWLAAKSPGLTADDYQVAKSREEDFTGLLGDLSARLTDLYRQPLSSAQKRQTKLRLLDHFFEEYEKWKNRWNNYSGYDRWLDEGLNNAKLASVSSYHDLIPSFRSLFSQSGSNFTIFYHQAHLLAQLPPGERAEELERLRQIFLTQVKTPSDTIPATKTPEVL